MNLRIAGERFFFERMIMPSALDIGGSIGTAATSQFVPSRMRAGIIVIPRLCSTIAESQFLLNTLGTCYKLTKKWRKPLALGAQADTAIAA